MHVTGHHFLGHKVPAMFVGDLIHQLAAACRHAATQNPPPALRAPQV
jgi:hypothetical protein